VGGLAVVESLRTGRGYTGIGACVLAVVLYLAVYTAGTQLLAGARTSVLSHLGFLTPSLREDALIAVALFVTAAGAFAAGEGLVAGSRLGTTGEPPRRVLSYRSPFVALVIIGIVVNVATGQMVDAQILELRGQVTGQGALAVLQQTLPIAIGIGILHRHWGSWGLVALSGLGLVSYLAVVQSRSMLLFVGLAVVVRLLGRLREHRVRPRDVMLLTVLMYVASLFVVAFGQWRSAVRSYGSSDFFPWLASSLPFPWQQLSARGSLDTLDGLVLSMNADRTKVGASVLDPLKGIVNLVPSQLWADKPEFLGPRVTHAYTDFGGRSGLFLSGPGYLYIVYAGALGMALASFLLGVLVTLLLRRVRRSVVLTTVVVYGTCRFMVGGDAFDLQYCLTILLSIGVGVVVARGVDWLRGVPQRECEAVPCA
jgi:hypothetical protein